MDEYKVHNYTGRLIDPFKMKAADIEIYPIARTLSRICRFRGQTIKFYSVAQHCVAMSTLFKDDDLVKWALVHEFFEGVTGMDVPWPLKQRSNFSSYNKAEERLLKVVAKKYKLPWPIPEEIHEADKRLCATEANILLPDLEIDCDSDVELYKPDIVLNVLNADIQAVEFAYVDLLFKKLYSDGKT